MPNNDDVMDFLSGSMPELEQQFGVASSTSKGTPMANKYMLGTRQAGGDPLTSDPTSVNPWDEWEWGFDNSGTGQWWQYHDYTPSGGYSGGGGPMYADESQFGGGYGTGGMGYGDSSMADATGNPTGSYGYEQELGNYVAPGMSQGYWSGQDDNPNSLIGGGMDTEAGQYGQWGSMWGFDDDFWLSIGIDPDNPMFNQAWNTPGPGDTVYSQNPVVTCGNMGGFWYNNYCNEYAMDDPEGWGITDESFTNYFTNFEAANENLGWFGDFVQTQFNSNPIEMEEMLSGIMSSQGADANSIAAAMAALTGNQGGTINWESLFSNDVGGTSGGGGMNWGGLYGVLESIAAQQYGGDFDAANQTACQWFGSDLPWC